MSSTVAAGTILAGFRVESLLGHGATGAVYLAEDTKRGGRVAIKVLAPELTDDERFRQRFLRESKLAASLDHPHIVPIVGAGEDNGVLYLAMAHVEGTDSVSCCATKARSSRSALWNLSARSPRPSMWHTPLDWFTGM